MLLSRIRVPVEPHSNRVRAGQYPFPVQSLHRDSAVQHRVHTLFPVRSGMLRYRIQGLPCFQETFREPLPLVLRVPQLGIVPRRDVALLRVPRDEPLDLPVRIREIPEEKDFKEFFFLFQGSLARARRRNILFSTLLFFTILYSTIARRKSRKTLFFVRFFTVFRSFRCDYSFFRYGFIAFL